MNHENRFSGRSWVAFEIKTCRALFLWNALLSITSLTDLDKVGTYGGETSGKVCPIFWYSFFIKVVIL